MTPARVLHVVGAMNRGGVETWLMHVLRLIDRTKLQFDFLVHTDQHAEYDDEIRALGGRVLACPRTRNPWSYARRFRAILRDMGPYRVVHSHIHHYSGFTLRLAAGEGVAVRIAHSHVDARTQDEGAALPRRLYRGLMTRWIGQHATLGLAASRGARDALFSTLPRDGRWRVLYCGIDLAPFHASHDRGLVRASLGLPIDAFVVGHVGRFATEKNHEFIVSVTAELAKRTPSLRLVLVGVGPTEAHIRRLLGDRGLEGKTLMTGVRHDVPRILAAMDCFLFPSRFEGLGLALVEAQAAGVPCVVADGIPEEATVVPGLVTRLPLTATEDVWADAVANSKAGCDVTARQALAIVEGSQFNIRTGVDALLEIYESGPSARRQWPAEYGGRSYTTRFGGEVTR